MKRRSVTRALALAMSLIMLSGEAMPAFAAGSEGGDAQVVEAAADEETAEEDAEEADAEESVSEDNTVSEDAAASENEAVSEDKAVSENEAEEEEISDDDESSEEEPEQEDTDSSKPAGTPVATAEFGANVTGSIYNDGGRVILYIDGSGSVINKKFKESALKDYKITDLSFGGNVSKINDYIFDGVSTLERIEISSQLTEIGGYVFRNCTALKSLTFEKGGGELKIGWNAFAKCTSLNNVTLPARVSKKLGDNDYSVFSGCTGLSTAAMEEGSTFVPGNAFANSALKNITIPSTVKEIGGYAFYKCGSLSAVTLPASTQTIGDYAFYKTGLTKISFPGSVVKIGGYTFKECASLEGITFEPGKGTLEIGWNAFANCTRLNNVILPARTKNTIGEHDYSVFSGCTGLSTAAMEEGSTFVPGNAFANSALKNITIPSTVKEIGGYAFYKCGSLSTVTLSASTQTIGDYAFYKTGLTKISFPGSVVKIGGYTFKECASLEGITFEPGKGTLEIGWNAFANCTRLNNVILPARTKNTIGDYDYSVFSGCTSLVTAGLEAGIPYVPSNAFSRASSLKNIDIPSSVKEIGSYAFANCTVLENIPVSQSVTKIGGHAFYGCSSISTFAIPNKVSVIEMYCFSGCTMLTEITLPDKIKEIKYAAFYKCDRLAKVRCSKVKSKIRIGDLNTVLNDAEWEKISAGAKVEPKTGELTLDGVKVNSLKDAFKQMKDKDKAYVINLQSNLKGEKNLTIPKNAQSVTINGNGYMIEITGTKLTSNVPLTLNNIKFRAVSKKGAASKFTINAKKDLTINTAIAFEAKSTSVRAGAKLSINCNLSADKVSSKDLSIGATGVLTAVKGGSISVKNLISGANGASISLAEGFKPINLGGGAEGIIKINGVKVADGTQILKTSAKKLNEDTLKAVFDVSGIKTSTVSAHLYYYGSKACIFADAISFNGKTYGVWKTAVADMNAAQKEAKKNKTNATFTVTLRDNVNLMGKFLLPKKGYDSISIVSEGGHIRTMTFTSDITLTGNTTFSAVSLKKVNKKNEQVKGKIKKGKYTLTGAAETF